MRGRGVRHDERFDFFVLIDHCDGLCGIVAQDILRQAINAEMELCAGA